MSSAAAMSGGTDALWLPQLWHRAASWGRGRQIAALTRIFL